jgi:AbrB family looped-hinge helix DNA binding protein
MFSQLAALPCVRFLDNSVRILAPICETFTLLLRIAPDRGQDFDWAGFCGTLTGKFGGLMAPYATTKLSSRGQVVIPEEIRNNLGLREGDQFLVIGEGDAVILKTITPPKLEEFQELLSQARTEAKRASIKKADLKSAIAKVRRRAK